MDNQEIAKIELYKHQKRLIKENKPKSLLPWSCGAGKTIGLIFLIAKNNIENKPVLLICIKSDLAKWVNIIKKFKINADVMTKEMFKKIATKKIFKKVYDVIKERTVEIKKTRPCPQNIKFYNYVIFDEAHCAVNLTSMMHKSFYAYLKFHQPQFIWLATATPYPNNPWGLYGLAKLLGYEWHYKRFQNHFFSLVKMGARMIPVKKKIVNDRPVEKEIAAYINFLGKSVNIEDCIDMPEKILIEEYFELTPEQKREYEAVDENLILTENLKKHQICGGTLHSVEKNIAGDIISDENLIFKSQKLDRAVELCQEHKKIFFVCKYQNEVDYLEKTFKSKLKGRTILTFTGKNSAGRPKMAVSTDSMPECIIIANAACSSAYEVKTIKLMVFYSYDFSLVNYEQMCGRCRRINNPAPRTYLSLICKNTIDEDVYECIKNKRNFTIAIYGKNN